MGNCKYMVEIMGFLVHIMMKILYNFFYRILKALQYAVRYPFPPIPSHPLPPFHAWRSNPKSRKEGKGNVGPSLTGGWTQRMIRQYTVNLPCVTTKSMMDDGRDLP